MCVCVCVWERERERESIYPPPPKIAGVWLVNSLSKIFFCKLTPKLSQYTIGTTLSKVLEQNCFLGALNQMHPRVHFLKKKTLGCVLRVPVFFKKCTSRVCFKGSFFRVRILGTVYEVVGGYKTVALKNEPPKTEHI